MPDSFQPDSEDSFVADVPRSADASGFTDQDRADIEAAWRQSHPVRASMLDQFMGSHGIAPAELTLGNAVAEGAGAVKGALKAAPGEVMNLFSKFNALRPFKSAADLVDAVEGLYRGAAEGASDARAAQRVGQSRTPIWSGASGAPTSATEVPTAAETPKLPSGRVPPSKETILDRMQSARAAAEAPKEAPEPPLSGPTDLKGLANFFEDKLTNVGQSRTLRNGQTEILRRVPLGQISDDPGNKIYDEAVAKYQQNLGADHPQLRVDTENPGEYVINEGHHRIHAQARNGADSVLAWTPAESGGPAPVEAPAGKNAIEMPKSTANIGTLYKDLKATSPQGAADWVQGKVDTSIDAKTQKLAKWLDSKGFTHDEVDAKLPKLSQAEQDQFWKNAAAGASADLGETINPPNSLEAKGRTMFHLRRASAPQSTPTTFTPSPELMKQLQKNGGRAGTIGAQLAAEMAK